MIIQLPFTCNQLKYVALIGFPLLFLYGLLFTTYGTIESLLMLSVGGGISFAIWIIYIIDSGKFPTFRCKCDK